jgi:signal transduction histidine kinase/CheY-like chemotaxis protein
MPIPKSLKIIDFIRLSGINHAKNNFAARATVYLNTILLCTWLNYLIYWGVLFSIQDSSSVVANTVFGIINGLYITVFLATRIWGVKYTRYLFMFTVYAMIASTQLLLGNNNFNQIFYFAFLPSAYVLFSLSNEKIAVVFFLLLLLFLIFWLEYNEGHFFNTLPWVNQKQQTIRLLNLTSGFVLCALYSGFIMINTARKQGKLITQSSSLQTTLDNAMVAIWSINKNYDLLAVNKIFINFGKSIFGDIEIKIGKNLRQYIEHEKIPANLRQHYYDVLNGKQVFDEFNFKNREYEVRAIPLKAHSGEIIGATFSARDITNLKSYQSELLKAKETAEKASMARTLFLSNMSHELRTPLNGIAGITHLMLDEQVTPNQKNNLEIMAGLNSHMVEIINNILDYTKIESGKAVLFNEEFNLKKKIEKITKIFELPAKEKNIEFKVEVHGEADINLITDRTKVNQIFINLISNAIKFTKEGAVTFKVVIENHANNNFVGVAFSVQDTGIGIKKENLEKIFESFTQADINTTRLFGGTGLGLTIADKNLKLFGWPLEVESELGKGTTFKFLASFPKAAAASVTNKAVGNNFAPMPATQILLAEDNAVNQMVAKKFLQKWQIQVSIANNGQEALDAIAEKDDFSLILMDLDMPVLDGYEATKQIKLKHPNLPVIALTAATIENIKEELSLKGFDNVIQKPFIPEQLYNTIKNAIPSP